MKQILINCGGLETRVAVTDNGKLQDYFIERRNQEHLVGSIYKGRICNLEASLQAAFVDIGQEKNAFLHYWDMIPASQDMLEEDNDEREEEENGAPAPVEDDEPAPPPAPTAPVAPAAGSGSTNGRPSLLERLKRTLFARNGGQPAAAAAPQPPPAEGGQGGGRQGGHRRQPQGGGRNPRSQQQHHQPHHQQQQQQRRRQRPSVSVEDIPNLFKTNTDVLVQVTKGPIGTKGPRVTTNLSIPGRYLVLLPNSSHVGISKRIEDREERDRLRRILRGLEIPRNMGVICRTVGAGKSEKAFRRDLDTLLAYWQRAEQLIKEKRSPCCVYQEPDLVERTLRDYLTEDMDEIVCDNKELTERVQVLTRDLTHEERVDIRFYNHPKPLFFKYNLSDQIDSIFSRRVPLPSGGYICVDETEALIAIDVNSGKNRGGKDHPETILKTNMEAAAEVARQLRLRNIGGLVVVDLIDMRSRKDQQTVLRVFKEGLLADRAKTKVLPISPLGLLEMTRQREQESLQDTVYAPCPYCEGKGLVKSATSMSVEIQNRLRELLRRRGSGTQIRVNVHPDVLERLKNEDADLIQKLEQEFRGELSFRPDPGLHTEEFKIFNAATGDEL
ncbi:MAG: Rne/Rng family ribonuclease [Lentisphaeria bacterium]